MKSLHVRLKTADSSYKILIGSGIFKKIAGDLKKNPIGNRYAIITDSFIEKLYGKKLLSSLRKKGIKADLVSFKGGETSKNLKTFTQLSEQVFSLGLDRSSAIIALGGGVVGDMAGYVAGTYMRGIPYIHVPTTLLAQVDSSIGGKVGVDLSEGKNCSGLFHQPKKVYIDVALLKMLPVKQIQIGLAEVIKHALIKDRSFFIFLEKNIEKILNLDMDVLIKTITWSCKIKIDIVKQDEKEKGMRMLVNYGHTIGHAIEAATKYRKYTHGEAVAIGMVIEGAISNRLGYLSNKGLERQNKLIMLSGLPTKMDKNIKTEKLIRLMKKDKKSVSSKVRFVLLKRIGQAFITYKVPDALLRKILNNR